MHTRIKLLGIIASLLLLPVWPGLAQLPEADDSDETPNVPPAMETQERLADIRSQLLQLYGQMATLRAELIPVTPGRDEAALQHVEISVLSARQRLDGLEEELRIAISKIEELEFRILRIAADGNNQIRDLEFTLAEIAGTDLSLLSPGRPLGEEPDELPVQSADETVIVADLSSLEQQQFQEAFQSYQNRDMEGARERLNNLIMAYPDGSYVSEAYYYLGETLIHAEDWQAAGIAFFNAFNKNQSGPMAPKALLRLGESLAMLDRQVEACEIIQHVGEMFPGSGEAGLADSKFVELECG
ncbi:MAG: hypothetical protein OXE84_13635 [Rhodobacteraceae bacterium]|nr:hypothetical protein [Paracoccaceae bacterium]MCY4327601.1 hypothetical protein [Paracoccaceae bacterium]